jgi:hypothetical protein
MTNPYLKISLGFAAGAFLGLATVAPLIADTERFEVEGLDKKRGPFVGHVDLTSSEGAKLQVVRTVVFSQGGSESLSGSGQRRGAEVRAQLLRATGATGALTGKKATELELQLLLNAKGRCQTRLVEGKSLISRGEGAHPGKALSFLADLGPKGATKDKKLQSEHYVERFEGTPFVKGKGDKGQIDPNDPAQGALGDCYLIAAMIAVARTDPGVIRKMITTQGGGKYTVRLHGVGTWGGDVTVSLDDKFPSTGKGRMKMMAYVSSSDRKVTTKTLTTKTKKGKTKTKTTLYELWPSLIEKAYAKQQGGFAKIEGGHADNPFEFLSGKSATSYYPFFRTTNQINGLIRNAIKKGYPICVGMKNNVGKLGRKLNITGNHCYVLVAEKGGYFKLYNPWQSSHPTRSINASELRKLSTLIYIGEF